MHGVCKSCFTLVVGEAEGLDDGVHEDSHRHDRSNGVGNLIIIHLDFNHVDQEGNRARNCLSNGVLEVVVFETQFPPSVLLLL